MTITIETPEDRDAAIYIRDILAKEVKFLDGYIADHGPLTVFMTPRDYAQDAIDQINNQIEIDEYRAPKPMIPAMEGVE